MEIKEKTYCVYVHRNKINGKIYIGQTCQKPERRWKNGEGYKCSSYFYHAIQKYGWYNFEHIVVLNGLSFEDANYFEEILIKKFDSMNPNKGYNLQSGGDGHIYSEQARQNMSQSRKGAIFTDEHKINISKSRKGISPSEETRKRLSEAKKGKKHPLYGTHRSRETKEKLSKANKGYKHTQDALQKISESSKGLNHWGIRKVAQYDLNGNLIKIWDYIMQVELELNIKHTNISKCCRGKYKTAGGFVWKYVN